ncbi:hypothetical protein [Kineococcus sp. SYSU DK003]|uniref:hypothetical protein n=1 Tax=Kineococcus sp. SYSU DK003 TaxID=3383124 RepID=UPI003D7EA52F
MTRSRWWRRGEVAVGGGEELRREVERLTQENMRLRLEQQRPQSLSEVTAKLRETLPQMPAGQETLESQDEAYHVLAEIETMRRSLIDVLDALAVATAQMRRQLSEGVPLAEIDRRVTDRRRPRGAHVAEADPLVVSSQVVVPQADAVRAVVADAQAVVADAEAAVVGADHGPQGLPVADART